MVCAVILSFTCLRDSGLYTFYILDVAIRFGGDAVGQTMIPEAAGFLNASLYIIKDGETEQPLYVQLTVTNFGATKGRTGL